MSSPGQFIRLETVGRRTGKPHAVLLRYATFGQDVIVFPDARSRQDWVMNIERNPRVKIHAEGKVIEGVASVERADDLKDPVLAAFSRKYGGKTVRDTYWGQTKYLRIRLGAQVLTEDINDLIYADLEAAFDGVAEDYDRHIFGNPMNVWLRNRSVSLMLSLFKPGDTVVEIGCGTGTETLSLARRGIRVYATDLSSKMLEVMGRKAKAAGLSGLVIPVHCRPYMLAERLRELDCKTVDGAYSTYGAVNTEPRLDDFFDNLHAVLRPNGRLVLGVWNKYCLFEIAGYLMKANPGMATARLRNPVPVGKSRFCVATNAYSIGSLNRIISSQFVLDRAYGVCVFLPPSNLLRYMPPTPALRLVKRFETRVGGAFPWKGLGDHFLGVYRKNG